MSSLHLVHPELRPMVIDAPHETMDVERLRMRRENPVPAPPVPDVPGVTVEQHHISGPAGAEDVRVLLYRPIAADGLMPAILHLHGGGFIMGAPEASDGPNRVLADALGAVIVSVAYRLAPEHPFPAALEDAYAALAWLHAQAGALGVDRARIAVKGESAGGGLAAGLALYARDMGELPIAYQCLTYPMIDDRAPAEPHPHAGEFVWSAASNHFGWTSYLGHTPGGDGVSSYAAPSRALDLSGLPPALIVATSLDLFVDENIDYAQRLLRAGVPTELLVYPGAYHGFQMAGPTTLAARYVRDVREALAAALGVAPSSPA